MRIAYRDEYLAGSGALRILVLAMAAFALFVIAATILTSAGRPFLAAAAAGFALIVVVAGNIAFVRWAGLDGGPLEAAATGTAAGTGLALILVAGLLYWQFRTFLPLSTTLRSAIAGFSRSSLRVPFPIKRPSAPSFPLPEASSCFWQPLWSHGNSVATIFS